MSTALGITAFALAILIAVLIHELGHLVTAKAFGMRADRYFVGFGPTLWSTRRGETEYGVKAFPLGGFVSIRGMSPLDERRRPVVDEVFDAEAVIADREHEGELVGASGPPPAIPEATWHRLTSTLLERGTPRETAGRIVHRTRATVGAGGLAEARGALTQVLITELGDSQRVGDLPWRVQRGDEGRFYNDRPRWQRALAILFGPVTHLLIAFGLLLGGYLLIAQPTGEPTTEIAAVLPDTPAEDADLEPGDRVLAVGDVASEDYEELRDAIRQRPGEPTTLEIERDGQPRQVELVPVEETDPETGETIGLAGFAPSEVTEQLGPVEALRRAAIGDEREPIGGVVPMLGASVEGLIGVFRPAGLGDLVSTSVGAQERDPEGAVSVIGIANLAGGVAGEGGPGMFALLFLLAYINVFLFIFNMVPLPPFDGGHLAVLGAEKLGNLVRRTRGRPETYTVDPRTITAIAIPVLGVLLLVFVTTLWLDISDPITFG